jgi:hypothetical protein
MRTRVSRHSGSSTATTRGHPELEHNTAGEAAHFGPSNVAQGATIIIIIIIITIIIGNDNGKKSKDDETHGGIKGRKRHE